MINRRLGLRVSAVIFAIFAVGHLIRLAANLEVRIGGLLIPVWPSIIFVILAGALSVWLWRLSKGTDSP